MISEFQKLYDIIYVDLQRFHKLLKLTIKIKTLKTITYLIIYRDSEILVEEHVFYQKEAQLDLLKGS